MTDLEIVGIVALFAVIAIYKITTSNIYYSL